MPWTTVDIPDQQGRVALITGANSGLGLETTRVLLAKGTTVIMACRSRLRGEAVRQKLLHEHNSACLDLLELDLADLNSVRRAAGELHHNYGRLDLLFNNAGVMAPPRRLSEQGFELQFAVNHLGHMALTQLVLPLMETQASARVVSVSSGAHYFARINWTDLQGEVAYNRWQAYAQSKLANIMFALELNGRLRNRNSSVSCLAAHPGLARTNLQSSSVAANGSWQESLAYKLMAPLFQSAAMGALPQLHAATAASALGGELYGPGGPGNLRGFPTLCPIAPAALKADERERLWTISQELCGC
ncbi:MAG: oxidoreductase [Prochlorococcus sp.]